MRKDSQNVDILAGKIGLRGENEDSKEGHQKSWRRCFYFFPEPELSGKLHNSVLLTTLYVAVHHDSDSFGRVVEHSKCVADWSILGQERLSRFGKCPYTDGR